MVNLRARTLRKSMTPQEIKLWVQLRYFKQRSFHFRRQAPIGPYIADFGKKTRKLLIEVDGSQHGLAGGVERDVRRDQYYAGRGYLVLRFWNIDIDTNMDGVIDAITADLKPPSPRSGERGERSGPGGVLVRSEEPHPSRVPRATLPTPSA